MSEAGLPPGPRLPGALQTLLWVTAPMRFAHLCRQRYGSVFTVRMVPFGDVVYVTDPTGMKEVFTADPDLFRAGEANSVLDFVVGASSVLLLDGPAHTARRRALMPALHGESVRRYGDLVDRVVSVEVSKWPVGRPFRLHPRMQAITLEIMMRAVFGGDDGPSLAGLRQLVPSLLHVNPAIMFVPRLRRHLGGHGPWARFLRIREGVDRIVYGEIERRRRAGDATGRDDILSLLLAGEHPMTDTELRDQLVTMLINGHESTATTMAWVFERALRHPDVLRRLREDDGEYVDAVVNETLRVRPVTMDVGRILSADTDVAGYRVPAGTLVAPSLALLHRSPDLYPRPERFDPTRFLHQPRANHTFLPFGGGTHRCLGANFATMEMTAVVSGILRRAELRAPIRRSERMRPRGPILVPANGATVVLDRRL